MEHFPSTQFQISNHQSPITKKALVTDDCHPVLLEGLEKMGYRCDFEPNISPAETLKRIGDYEGLVINSKILVNRAFLDAAKKLEFVARLGSGMEIVDREYAEKLGVKVISSPEGNRNAVAEQAMGMLLALSNNLLRADREVRQKIWRREANRGWELREKTVGIIGFGHTGSSFAKKLAGFEVEVLAFDKYKPVRPSHPGGTGFAKDFSHVRETEMGEIFEKSDIISLHLPLTDETKFLVNQNFVKKCKRGVIIINTSRGKCVNTLDLVEALENGQVGGACLDVFENEKPETFTPAEHEIFDRLYKMENVVLSPHVAGWTFESKYLLGKILVEKLLAKTSAMA